MLGIYDNELNYSERRNVIQINGKSFTAKKNKKKGFEYLKGSKQFFFFYFFSV